MSYDPTDTLPTTDEVPEADTPAGEDGRGRAARSATRSRTCRSMNGLRAVVDPEIGYNIVDLGLVYEVTKPERGYAHVLMTLTSMGLPADRGDPPAVLGDPRCDARRRPGRGRGGRMPSSQDLMNGLRAVRPRDRLQHRRPRAGLRGHQARTRLRPRADD
jgi:hypothetical protein